MSEAEYTLLSACSGQPKSTADLLKVLGYGMRTGNFKAALRRLSAHGLLEMTIPDKPRSRNQRYRITPLGLEVLRKIKGKE